MTNEAHARIESELEINAYIQNLKYALNHGAKIEFQVKRRVDEKVLCQVNRELKEGMITVEDAMRRTKIGSKSTFYRKIRLIKENN